MLIKNYWHRYIVWIGLIIALLPLLIIIHLQYRSLCELEQTSTNSYKMAVKTYLKSVVAQLEEDYRINAEKTLNPFVDVFTQENNLDNKALSVKHWPGAKQIFIVSFDEEGAPLTHFYNSSTQLIKLQSDSREKRAVNTACTLSNLRLRLGSTAPTPTTPLRSNTLTINELDPENRLILKPITDSSGSIIGMAGLIVDVNHFKTRLEQAIKESLPTVFPEDNKEMIITVKDSNNHLLMSSCSNLSFAKCSKDEVEVQLPFIFTDWILGYQRVNMTIEELAHKNFVLNFTVSILMALILLIGIAITLHTIAREIKLSQMKTDFVSNVSHELRTPLSSIRVFGEFMRLGWVKDSAKVREYGEYIETESRRLTQLIDNILDFSRISSDRKIYQMDNVNIKDLIQTTLKTFEVLQKQQSFNILLELPENKLPLLQIDANAIAQALVNLIDNAIKYSGEEKNILVQLDVINAYVTIAVIDNGIGIERCEQTKIFDKFYRVSTDCVHDVKGSGLGLSIVKHIIDAHQGKVTIDSTIGKGSKFTIYLPIKKTINFSKESVYVESPNC